jgi:DNA helicase-2/ATP-dependent DNA helicase PcrA
MENPHAEHLEELLEGLNEPQREAVTHGEGPLLILAGAGSGKTRVLTHRIAFLVYTDQAQAGEILAITFTNKAASEMRGRVERLLGRATRGMWLMTFHSACARILRAEAERLGYTRQFTIYDQADARRLTKRCIDELGIDPKRYPPAAIHNRISMAKNRLLAAADTREAGSAPFEAMVADAYELYERDLHRMNAMDFDDLLFRTVNLLELFEDVRERYSSAFRHVLVDEYQDTNYAQYRLLQLLVNGARQEQARNLAVVGDDSQSIYSFRGAEIRNILDFQEDFPDARVIKLEQNYRSTQTILSAANAVIANNRGGIVKRLWSELGEGERLQLATLADEHAEARYVVGEIERLVDEGVARTEIAVLYRTNALSRVIEDTLVRHEIAYQVIGGTKFYERAEIKDAIAYLSLLTNPSDAVSFGRVANTPRRGLGQTSLARIISHAAGAGIPVWDAASAPEQIPALGAAAVKAMRRFMDTMNELRSLAGVRPSAGESAADEVQLAAATEVQPASAPVSVGELLQTVLSKTGYLEALEAERTIEAQGRIENLEELIEVGREFDAAAEAGEDTLAAFLQQVALLSDADSRSDEEGLVTLMTVHNAKGLEYPVVFITGCEDGVFPHSRALDEGGLDEERRLFYVGVTRAMRELYLTWARRRAVFGAQSFGVPSRFLGEIPGELVEETEPGTRSWNGDLGAARAGVDGVRGTTAGAARDPTLARWASSRGGGASSAPGTASRPGFRMGDDLIHAAFGEGVVTGVEPGGVIVVRFAGDGSERKLMADYAPLSRR